MRDYKEVAERVLARRDEHARKRKKKIKRISVVCGLCMAVAVVVGIWQSAPQYGGYSPIVDQFGDGDLYGESEYNTDIKTDKPNGSILKFTDHGAKTLADFLDMADAVFIGTVTTDGEKYDHPSGKDKSNLTKITIAVEDVIYGEVEDDEIGFIQSGSPGTDDLEMKVKRGDRVLVLAYFDEEMMCYRSVMFENGIFYIREDGLYTYSNQPNLGKYDGTPTELLVRDIGNLIKQK